MITIGATARGYTKGVEATAFSKWNEGIVDKFKEGFEPADVDAFEENYENSNNAFPEQKDVINNYQQAMAYHPRCFGLIPEKNE